MNSNLPVEYASSRSPYVFGNGFRPVAYRLVPPQQGGSLTFTPEGDAYIHSSSPNNKYGSATTLQVDDSPVKHFLLMFEVSGESVRICGKKGDVRIRARRSRDLSCTQPYITI